MKVLVTGANGYIGARVVKKLCDLNIEVIATDFNNVNIDSRAKYINVDIFEKKDDWFSYFDKPDVCLHLAWRDGFIHNSPRHLDDLDNHFNFMKNLIDNGLKQIACMGTMHEVGYHEGAIYEDTHCNPISNYGIAKNKLRNDLKEYCLKKNCKFQWLRAYYIYGDDLYGNSIFCKIRQAVKDGKELFPFTTGENKFDFIHVDELAKQISMCVIQNKVLGIINVCSGNPVSLAEQIEWYIKYNNLPIKLDYGKFPNRPGESPCIYGDNTKIKEVIAYANCRD